MLQAEMLLNKLKEKIKKWLKSRPLIDAPTGAPDTDMDTARRSPTNEATPKTIFKIKF